MNKAILPDDQDLNRRVQIMTTTHFTLSTQRASTIAEANGRSTMFFTSVSMSLIALGFIAQATAMSAAFYVFAFVLLACLAIIGLFTFNRVAQTSVEDALLARGEGLVRSFYADIAPGVDRWFVLPTGKPDRMAFISVDSNGQMMLTAATMIGIVNSVILGVTAALAVVRGLSFSLAGATLVGATVFIAAFATHLWRHSVLWKWEGGRTDDTSI